MLRQGFVAAAVACAFGWPALAQTQDAHDFMKGVYASSKDDCAKLAKGGLSAIEEGAVLTSEGLHAYEYYCDFVDIKPRAGSNKGWVATGFCEEPDDQYPELVAIAPFGEDSVRAIFLTDFTLDSGTGDDGAVGDDGAGDDDDGGSSVSPPSDQTAKLKSIDKKLKGKLKGISEPGGDDDGADVEPGPGGDDDVDVSPGGDDDGAGTGDDDDGAEEANFNEFFFCAGVSKDKLK